MAVGHRRNNGFSKRPHPLQLLSYFIVVGEMAVFWVLVAPTFSGIIRLLASILFGVISLFVLIFWFASAYIDPSDDVSIAVKNARAKSAVIDTQKYNYYCDLCHTHVQSRSKHCRQCDRCVPTFDHHCKWINNCIGEHNYKPFIGLITSVLAMQIVFTGFSTTSAVSFNFSDEYNGKLSSLVIICVYSLIGVIFTILDLNLVLLHAWLIKNKMTTYDFIISRREKVRITPMISKDTQDLEMTKKGSETPANKEMQGMPSSELIIGEVNNENDRKSVVSSATGNSLNSPDVKHSKYSS